MEIARQRIRNDLKRIKINWIDHGGILIVGPIDKNLFSLRIVMWNFRPPLGKDEILVFDIQFSDDYPFAPPIWIRFLTSIEHERVDGDGYFRLDILNPCYWTPGIDLADLIEFVRSALVTKFD